MDQRTRRELTRYGAPAAFLAAATIAVLLIKAGLSGGSDETTTGSALPTGTTTTPVTQTHRTTATTTTAARFYTIESGDTLGSVAIKEHTTVDELLRLNPGIDPEALHVGQRIRVG
jgi:peptidoglycan endopeptidase LytE